MFTEDLYINVHNIIQNSQKWDRLKCLSISKWVNNMSYIHLEYYSPTKRHEVMIHATIYMNFVLREKSQTKRPHIIWFHLYDISIKVKSIETESRVLVV